MMKPIRHIPITRCLACAFLALFLAACLLCTLCLASCAVPLRVNRGQSVTYHAADGSSLRADYYSLSDGSLTFVKLALPDGTVLTLPNAVSASGARYTDDREYVWWEKGATAVLEKRDESGEFRDIAEFIAEDDGR